MPDSTKQTISATEAPALVRVAKAMAENAGFSWTTCAQSQWISDARAGVEALRNPSDDALLAAGKPYGGAVDCAAGLQLRRESWNKILDAILSEAA